MYYNNVLDLIGNTPLMCLQESTGYNIFAKAEFLNPGGSIKDRIAKNMIETAEAEGKLKPGMTIIEPTSGNTGIGLALVGVRKGYEVIIVMPENMSEERKKVIQAFGAKLILTEPKLSIGGAVDKANEIASANPEKYYMPQQFVNPANPEAHYRKTAVELSEQLGKKIDIYVSGVGSGGTLQGIAKYLLEQNPAFQVDVVFMDALVERTDGNTARSRQQRKAHVATAQSQRTGGRLVVLDCQDRNLRLPVGRDQADFRCILHNTPCAVCQTVQDGGIGS